MYIKRLIEIKETIFLYLFFYGLFDLEAMKSINIFFNDLIKEAQQ